MKHFMLATGVLFLSAGLSFSQPAAAPAPVKAVQVPAVISVAGKVQSITQADVAKGTKSEIAIVGVDAAVKVFLVKGTTTIYDINGKPLALKDLKKDDQVKVNYKASTEGVLEALGIFQTK